MCVCFEISSIAYKDGEILQEVTSGRQFEVVKVPLTTRLKIVVFIQDGQEI